jgi:anti-anti-sigma regulatory factor
MPFPWKPSSDAPVPASTQRGLPEFAGLMLDSLPNPTVLIEVVGPKRYRFCAANKLGINSFGINVIVGKYIEEVVPEEYIQPIYQIYGHTVEQKTTISYEQNFNPDPFSEAFWLSISCIPILDYRNDVSHLLSYGEDINARKKLELLQQEQQAATLAELSTPLLSISDDTLVMPLIGAVDSARVNQLIQTLLNGASQRHARMVILDITGVQIVDTQVANALIQAAQSLNLLGTSVALSGIRPEVAQTLVGLGINLNTIRTYATLQSAIAATIRV